MQCLQRVLYSLLSLQKHRVGVKVHQNNLQISKIIPRLDRAPGSKIPGSASDDFAEQCLRGLKLQEFNRYHLPYTNPVYLFMPSTS